MTDMGWTKGKIGSIFFVATVLALLCRVFIVEVFRVVSTSMEPNLKRGDLVFVSKSAFNLRIPFSTFELVTFSRPVRGEVVAFNDPSGDGDVFVKRVVALEGDEVEMRDGNLLLNGKSALLSEPTPERNVAEDDDLEWENLDRKYPIFHKGKSPSGTYGPVLVPKNHFFVLGDNRQSSQDSRAWGPVPFSHLRGRVTRVWISLDDSGAVRKDRIWKSIQ